MLRVRVFREALACIFVVCLSSASTMQVDSVILQVSDGASSQQRRVSSWTGEPAYPYHVFVELYTGHTHSICKIMCLFRGVLLFFFSVPVVGQCEPT